MTLGTILPLLARHINTTFALQIPDPQHPDYGGEYRQRIQRPSGVIALRDCND